MNIELLVKVLIVCNLALTFCIFNVHMELRRYENRIEKILKMMGICIQETINGFDMEIKHPQKELKDDNRAGY